MANLIKFDSEIDDLNAMRQALRDGLESIQHGNSHPDNIRAVATLGECIEAAERSAKCRRKIVTNWLKN